MTTMTRALALAALLAASAPLATGCADSLDDGTLLDDLRVLTILSDPGELAPGEAVTLEPVVYVPDGAAIASEAWTVCPFSVGDSAAFACAIPACEVPLEADDDGLLRVTPLTALQPCFDALAAGAGGDASGALSLEDAPDALDLVFRYTVATVDGASERVAVKRLYQWVSGPPPQRNAAPVVAAVEARLRDSGDDYAPIEDLAPVAVGAAVDLRVRLTGDSAETYLDDEGNEVVEDPYGFFFATAGALDATRAGGLEQHNVWTAEDLEDSQTEALLYVVVGEERGANAVAGPFAITISRP